MIDERADIHPTAKIAKNVKIGPWTIIGEHVEIGEGTEIASNVYVGKHTKIGRHNKIFQFASVGGDPQYSTYTDQEVWLEIGDHNVIREFTTLSRGSPDGGALTKVGSHNFLMAYTHIAHDCVVGNHVVLANNASIAGHVHVEDYVGMSAFVGVHQRCHIGAYSFLGRATKIYQDILPYMLVAGNPGIPKGLNLVGLRRNGFDGEALRAMKQAFQLIYREAKPLPEIIVEVESLATEHQVVQSIVHALKNPSSRGIARHERNDSDD